MKTNVKLFIGLLLLVNLIACRKDILDNPPAENPTAVTVKLGSDITMAENAGVQEILIQFDQPALKAGIIEVEVTTATPNAFQTSPTAENGIITLAVVKGDTKAAFTVNPVNNDLIDEERTILFEITDVTDGFLIGTKKSAVITIQDDENAIVANFSNTGGLLYENTPTGLDIKVLFSAPAFQSGKVILQLEEAPETGLFTTQPAMDANGRVELPVEVGATAVNLILLPTDDHVLKAHHDLSFLIVETGGGIIKGENISFSMTLIDDELAGMPHSYVTNGGGWSIQKTFIYNENGSIREVQWETATPNPRSGTDTYFYAGNGMIERVKHTPAEEEYFYQENGRIVRSETVKNGIKTEYSDYDYDPAGNIGGRAQYHRQANGSFTLSFLFIYLYDFNGNLNTQLTYIPGSDPENPTLISTRTFEGYLNTPNPFISQEVIPAVQAQPFLPLSYRVQENGSDLMYTYSYDFREDGKPSRRTTSGSAAEVTTYQYY